jgi:hypothetical protein
MSASDLSETSLANFAVSNKLRELLDLPLEE